MTKPVRCISFSAILTSAFARTNGSWAAQQILYRVFDHRALEEVGVHAGPQAGGISEDEIAKIVFSDQSVFDQFVSLLGHFGHIGDVPMADVGAEDGVEPGAKGKLARIERHGVDRVVSLAAEIEVGHEQIAYIFGLFDAAARPVVERLRVLIGAADAPSLATVVELVGDELAAVAAGEVLEQFAVEIGRIVVLYRLAVALLPMADHVGVETGRPSDSAFEKGASELRKTPGDAAKKHRLTQRLAGRGEMADMVEHVIRDRAAAAPAHAGRMETWRDAELDALGPYRIVVVLAVEREKIEPVSVAGGMRHGRGDRGNRPAHMPRHHNHLKPERLYGILDFFDRFLWRMH